MQEIDINWDTLERLRSRFLSTGSTPGVYWQSEDDLRHYHATFAARIGWKWDSALESVKQAGFAPASRTLFDWGCGSGIASLRFLEFFGPHLFDKVLLWDHSSLACQFAKKTIQDAYPSLEVEVHTSSVIPQNALTLISHAVNELGHEAQQNLSQQLRSASQILFVEPGDHSASRKLIAQRQALRGDFQALAPCTHCDTCPMLTEDNQRHWCHFFGKPPIEAFTEGFWSRFSQTMEIDLRSLPYSFLALQKKAVETPSPHRSLGEGGSRLIGRPRQFKGYTRLLSCDAQGLRELELQKREDKQLWKILKKEQTRSLYRWHEIDDSNGRLKSGEQL
ncbi:small ribosomal subunit Rsm22 family protein [Pelagicoccus mobilis]|uniref:Small ribosomal subunit Rsm22 n=1 Tax=Pelagicoccus mobilis TaxID=415221 RepID=A0A934VQH5_9BACT|nr:small ribosomal subunit Rsm22 family protein [Pelagicoccus mobilis]MBK1876905.1 hypothetical protein [Pelagicoccus mobilis]